MSYSPIFDTFRDLPASLSIAMVQPRRYHSDRNMHGRRIMNGAPRLEKGRRINKGIQCMHQNILGDSCKVISPEAA